MRSYLEAVRLINEKYSSMESILSEKIESEF